MGWGLPLHARKLLYLRSCPRSVTEGTVGTERRQLRSSQPLNPPMCKKPPEREEQVQPHHADAISTIQTGRVTRFLIQVQEWEGVVQSNTNHVPPTPRHGDLT